MKKEAKTKQTLDDWEFSVPREESERDPARVFLRNSLSSDITRDSVLMIKLSKKKS